MANNKTTLRKLKLQVQMSVDGYIAGPNGEMDWLVWNWDDKLKEYVNGLTESVDSILLGRKMAEGFISHWSDVMTKLDHPDYAFAKKNDRNPKSCFYQNTEQIRVGKYRYCNRRPYRRNQQAKETKRQRHHCLWWCII
jgi:hypothetical protein